MEGKEASLNSSSDLVVDRISALPDSILGAILSLLPTKNAVATSALSKRWEFLWKIVHNLDFYYYVVPNLYVDADNMKFVRFVDRVMHLHNGGSLNKFSLVWHARAISSHVNSWINIAITKYVHGLYLSLDYGELFDIPISGFNCDSLRSLELSGVRFFCDATAVCLPRLESMKLERVYFVSTEACEKLISGCPMLQYLYQCICLYPFDNGIIEQLAMPLSVFSYDSLRSLELEDDIFVPATIVVCLPRLEKLKLKYVNFESEEACEKLISGCPTLQYLYLGTEIEDDDYFTDNGDEDDDYFTCLISSASLRHLQIYFKKKSILKLKASSLESFKVSGSLCEIFVEESLRSLVQADFSTRLGGHDFSDNSIVETVRAFDCAKVLILSADVMLALSRATVSLSIEFKRLVKLVALTYCSSLQDVIQNSENLEELTIHQVKRSIKDVHGHSRWITPVEVPRCLSNNLKKVNFYGYNGLEDEREMIRYMLEHGNALENMLISCYQNRDEIKLKLCQEICEFPRKSPVCKVKFCNDRFVLL